MINYDVSHDLIHVKNVVALIKKILQKEGVPMESSVSLACVATGYAHEICDRKYCTDVFNSLKELEKIALQLFGKEIADIVTKVVPLISFTRRLQYGIPNSLSDTERFVYAVVSDADMLEAMGAVGVVRTYMYGCHVNRPTRDAHKYIKNELYNKCFEFLSFEWSKEEGAKRNHMMQLICEQIESERENL